MSESDVLTARELMHRLCVLVPVVEMRLFGSRAREDAQADSDLDVFIEVETVTRQIKDIIAETAWEIGFEKLIHVSPLVFSRDEIENSPQRESQIVKNIMREGIRL